MKKHVKPSVCIVTFLTLAALPLISLTVFRFPVTRVTIEGVAPDTPASITQPLVALKGNALMAVTPERVDAILQHRWVKCTGVKKILPGTLQVTLKIRRALVDVDGMWLDREGYPASALLSPPPPIHLLGEVDGASPARLIALVNAVPDLVATFPIIRIETLRHWVLSDDAGHTVHVDPFSLEGLREKWLAVQSRLAELPAGEGMDLRFRSTIIIIRNGGNHVQLARRH